jgi:hypothetical protein
MDQEVVDEADAIDRGRDSGEHVGLGLRYRGKALGIDELKVVGLNST